jgi:hypothetical protein
MWDANRRWSERTTYSSRSTNELHPFSQVANAGHPFSQVANAVHPFSQVANAVHPFSQVANGSAQQSPRRRSWCMRP